MEIKIKRGKGGRFVSAKDDPDQEFTVNIQDENELMKRVEYAVKAFTDPEEEEVDEIIKVDVTHHQFTDEFTDDIVEWFSNNFVKIAAAILFLVTSLYVTVRI